MEHNICRENLSAYLDGELPGGERLALEAHLAACPECARELAELKRNSDIFKRHAMEPVPPALKGAVFGAGRVEEKSPAFRWWPAAALTAAAAAAVVIFVLPRGPEGTLSLNTAFSVASDRGRSEATGNAFEFGAAGDSASFGSAAGSSGFGMSDGGAGDISAAPEEPERTAAAPAAKAESSPYYAAPEARADSSLDKFAPAASRAGAYGQAKFAAMSASGNLMTAGGGGAKLSSVAAVRGKRAEPAAVKDIVYGGVRYSAFHWRDTGVNGGSVMAYDASGRLLWAARVFSVREDPGIEADAQQVYIAAMALKGDLLEITDERGGRYRLDLKTRIAAPAGR